MVDKLHAPVRLIVLSAVAIAVLSGCSFTGVNSFQLPFTKGRGDDARVVIVRLENAANLVPNAEVKYRELSIGSVRKVDLKDWTATLTIGLDASAKIPADVTARIAQKSLLGAEYLELRDPKKNEASVVAAAPRMLKDGDVIDLNRTSRYPETEEVLSAAALVLNGGGLSQIQTISREANLALTGNTQAFTSFITQVREFAATLDQQRGAILGTLDRLDVLSSEVIDQRKVVKRTLNSLPDGVDALEKERPALVKAMSDVDEFGRTFRRVVSVNDDKIARVLRNIEPLTTALADQGPSVVKVLEDLTYPFNVRGLDRVVTSDYMNLHATIEVNATSLLKTFGAAVSLDGLLPAIVDGTPSGTAAGGGNPLTDPLSGLLGDLTGQGGPGVDSSGADGSPPSDLFGDLPGLLGSLGLGASGQSGAR
jgi:phospholipid/cholesterol/gamma-HCH transport system substrate-binding protein